MTDLRNITKRRIGTSELNVTPIGLGCMSLSGAYGASDDDNGVEFIRRAIDELGVDFLDSSDMYGWGHNESLLGKALVGRREQVVLATKFGQVQREGAGNGVDGSPEYAISACEASLQRLGVEVIDLYYQHRIDPSVPIEETVGAMARLVEQGKVRYIGLSEAKPETIRRAHATHPLAAVQTECSLLYREEAIETRALTTTLGISFVAYSPLGRSLLTGAYRGMGQLSDDSPHKRHPRFGDDHLGANLELIAPAETMADQKGCTLGQLALAWVLALGDDVIPIPGTKRFERLQENVGALNVTLSDNDLQRLEAAIPAGAAAGTRYPAGAMKAVQQ